MHKRIDLTLILCAFALHREARVAERTTYGRTVILRRCIRCSRHLAARGHSDPVEVRPVRPAESRYT